jgi:hypothetical protein
MAARLGGIAHRQQQRHGEILAVLGANRLF